MCLFRWTGTYYLQLFSKWENVTPLAERKIKPLSMLYKVIYTTLIYSNSINIWSPKNINPHMPSFNSWNIVSCLYCILKSKQAPIHSLQHQQPTLMGHIKPCPEHQIKRQSGPNSATNWSWERVTRSKSVVQNDISPLMHHKKRPFKDFFAHPAGKKRLRAREARCQWGCCGAARTCVTVQHRTDGHLRPLL